MRKTSYAAAVAALVCAVSSHAARADVVVQWMTVAEKAGETASKAGDPDWRTPKNTRAGSQTALAMFEAVNAVERRYEPYLQGVEAPAGASAQAAGAAAAHAVLSALYPDQAKSFDTVLTVSLAAVPDGPGEIAGVELGKAAAAATLRRAALPEGARLEGYRPATAPGVYVDGRLPGIKPFDLAMPPYFLRSASELRPEAPPPLNSARYARDLEEVRRLGAKVSKERPAHWDALTKAYLWSDYHALVTDVARRPGRTLSQNARLYAMAHMVADDAWLAVMEAKMHYATWRPITAIRNADRDGNDATTRDADWTPLLPTPTHPDYPCGHCGNAAALAGVLAAETGPAPEGGIRIVGYDSAGLERTLPTWDAYVTEMSMSRIYAGAHTRFANESAEAIGREVARRALAGWMRPAPRLVEPGRAPTN